MKNIAIMAATLCGNRGAETMLTSACGKIRERWPDAAIHIFSYYPNEDRQVCRDSSIRIYNAKPLALLGILFPLALVSRALAFLGCEKFPRRFSRRILVLENCDIMIDLAGEGFRDGREPFLAFNLLTLWPAFLLKTPVVKLSQAFGPARRPWTKVTMRHALKHCRHTAVRGDITAKFVAQAGAGPAFSTFPDLGFLYRPDYALTNESDAYAQEAAVLDQAANNEIWIGIVPNVNSWIVCALTGKDYVGWYVNLTLELEKRGIRTVFLPNCSRYGANSIWQRNNDIPLIRRIEEAANKSTETGRHLYITTPGNTAALRQISRRCRAVMTSRFHGMISALSDEVPVIASSPLHKFREVLRDFGLEEWILEECRESPAEAASLISRILEQEMSVKNRIQSILPAVRESAESQFEVLDQALQTL